MAFDPHDTLEIIQTLENFMSLARPPKEIRDKLDLNYRMDNQSIILFEIRPFWQDETKILTHDFAKTTYDRKNEVWKIYWLRANLKWNIYEPTPAVKKLSEFLKIVDADEFGCFKG